MPADDEHAAGVSAKELDLAQRLVDDMTEPWEPAKYKDTYREDLLKRIEDLATAGRTHVVKQAPRDEDEAGGGAQIIDLMAALKRSLEDKGGKAGRAPRRRGQARARRSGRRRPRRAAARA